VMELGLLLPVKAIIFFMLYCVVVQYKPMKGEIRES
jgi:hypothetical protein